MSPDWPGNASVFPRRSRRKCLGREKSWHLCLDCIFRFRRCIVQSTLGMAPLNLCFNILFYVFLLSLFTRITSALFIYDKGTLLDIGHHCTNLLQDTLSTDPAWPLEILRNTEVNKGRLNNPRRRRKHHGRCAGIRNRLRKRAHSHPEYKQRIVQKPPVEREVTRWSSHSEAMLQASLDDVDWDMFRASSADVSEFTDVAVSFINTLTDQATETVTIRTFSNQKPWVDRSIRDAVNHRTAAYNAVLLSGNMSEYKTSCYCSPSGS